jgi:hypothetical protein
MLGIIKELISDWIELFKENWMGYVKNKKWVRSTMYPLDYQDYITANTCGNARCFLALEFENEKKSKKSKHKKYLMGSVVNPGVLGRVALVIAVGKADLGKLINIREYFDYLREARGRSIDLGNVMILNEKQFIDSLEKFNKNLQLG